MACDILPVRMKEGFSMEQTKVQKLARLLNVLVTAALWVNIAALTLLGSDADFTGDQEQALASAVRRAARECAKLCG